MKIILIRHGATSGNLEKRYMGRTDEPLCEKGICDVKSRKYPAADIVISSPMKRCLETARLIYPNNETIISEGLRECDFGDFEGKNYIELNGDPEYQEWIDSGGEMHFPNGELPQDFRDRICKDYLRLTEIYKSAEILSLVVHGGTIMSVISEFALPKKSYYDCSVKNGGGYITEWDGKNLKIISEIL